MPEDVLREACDRAPFAMAVFDRADEVLYANPEFCLVHGCQDLDDLRATVASGTWHRRYGPRGKGLLDGHLPAATRDGRHWSGHLDAVRPDGTPETVHVTAVGRSGGGWILYARNPARTSVLERAVRQRERFFRLIAENTTDLVTLHELDGTYLYVSPSAARLLGLSPMDLVGTLPWTWAAAEDRGSVEDAFAEAREGASARFRFRSDAGLPVGVRWFESRGERITGPDGVDQIACSTTDVTQRQRLEDRLRREALHDPLTDLPNRTLFLRRLSTALARASRMPRGLAILFVDLDAFKEINDTFGHAAGDAVLVHASRRMALVTRRPDTVARLSGDEFAILVEDVDVRAAAEAAARRVSGAFREPVRVGAHTIRVRPSIGVAFQPPGRVQAPEELLRQADTAMYAAKRTADLDWILYDPDLEPPGPDIEAELRRALGPGRTLSPRGSVGEEGASSGLSRDFEG